MLMIWLHGLPSCVNPLRELYDALIYINRKDIAGLFVRSLVCFLIGIKFEL